MIAAQNRFDRKTSDGMGALHNGLAKFYTVCIVTCKYLVAAGVIIPQPEI